MCPALAHYATDDEWMKNSDVLSFWLTRDFLATACVCCSVCLFSENAKRPLSNDYYISSDVSHKFNSFGDNYYTEKISQQISRQKIPQKSCIKISHQKITRKKKSLSCLFQISRHLFSTNSCSIYISYLYPAFGDQFIYEFISKSVKKLSQISSRAIPTYDSDTLNQWPMCSLCTNVLCACIYCKNVYCCIHENAKNDIFFIFKFIFNHIHFIFISVHIHFSFTFISVSHSFQFISYSIS